MSIEKFKKRTIDLIDAIENIEDLTMCPSIFSDDINKHDCDDCPHSSSNCGDLYNPDICRGCWKDAIDGA